MENPKRIIAWAAEYVRRTTQASLSKSSYFSLIADEVTDHHANFISLFKILRFG